MKLKCSPTVAEFCGVLMPCDEFGPKLDMWVPDVKRALVGAMVTTSKDAVKEVANAHPGADDGTLVVTSQIAASALMARAHDFSRKLPTVARLFMSVARSWTDGDIVYGREDAIRVHGLHHEHHAWQEGNADDHTLSAVKDHSTPLETVVRRIQQASYHVEDAILDALGVATGDRRDRFRALAMVATKDTPDEHLRQCV